MKDEALKSTVYMLEKRSNIMLDQAKMEGSVAPEQEKFFALLHDEAFVKEFSNCDSPEAVMTLLDANGVGFSMEEVRAILAGMGALVQKMEENDGELSEEELEMVAGGFSWKGLLLGIGAGILVAAACIGAVAAVVGTGGAGAPAVIVAAKFVGGMAAAGGVIGTIVGSAYDL